MRVNEQWRLVFRWHGGKGEASDVYLAITVIRLVMSILHLTAAIVI
jgi:hypothetical protein